MNKTQMIDVIAAAADISKTSASHALDALLDGITDSLKQGQQVVITGFGTFTAKERAARTGRNPRTGETIQIAASKVAGFKAAKALKDALNS